MIIRRAVIYARVSTDVQEDDGTSLDTQVENCERYAKALGATVIKVFREAYTGYLYRERKYLAELREMCRKGLVDVVIFNTYDRLSRNQVHLAVLIDEMQHCNVQMECVLENLDNAPTGQFMRNALAVVAEVEREKIVYRTNEGKRKKARDGLLISGKKAMYGYCWRDGKRGAYNINPDEANVVEMIFMHYYNGSSVRGVVRMLNDLSIPTPMGKGSWGYGTVRFILTNRFYMGKAAAYRWKSVSNGGQIKANKVPLEEQIILPEGIVPPIVSEELFNAVQERLEDNKVEASRHNPNPEETLLRSGFIKCGYCRHTLTVDRASPRRTQIIYRCMHTKKNYISKVCTMGSSISSRMIDKIVWNYIGEAIQNFTIIEKALKSLQRINPHELEIRPIERRIKVLEETQESLVSDLKYSNLKGRSRELVVEELERIEGFLTALEEEKEKVRENLTQWQEAQDEIDEFMSWCLSSRDSYQTASYKEKRRALKVLGIVVYIYREDDEQHDRYDITIGLPGIMNSSS